MDRKPVDFRFFLVPLLIAVIFAALLSSRFLSYGGWDSTTLNYIVAGAIIGTTVFMVVLLVMLLIKAAVRRRK